MVVGTIFREKSNQVIASFDWYDSNTGTGYQRFYPCACVNSTTTLYFLSTKVIDGDVSVRQITANNTTTEVNFDVEFLNPMVIKGEAIINYTTTATANYSGKMTFTFYHVNTSGTETSIGTITSSTNSSASNDNFRRLQKVTLSEKSFASGEKLRLEVKAIETAAHDYNFHFDPASRVTITEIGTSATISSNCTVDVPFKIT